MQVVVVGARGQLGRAVVEAFGAGHDVTALGRDDLDITDDRAVAATLGRLRPAVVINCAAYNDVDGAEDNPIEALNANAFSVRALAHAASALGAVLVHYSTDFVFDGTAAKAYTEADRPNPRSVYAASKLLGEWFADDAADRYVLRVESLFGDAVDRAAGKGTIAGILQKLRAGDEIRIFRDRTISPTYVPDAARATRALVERRAPAGLYHCVNSGSCTWLEFAAELAARMGVEPRLVPVRMADAALRAPRPQFCALSNEKLQAAGVAMPSWQDALERFVQVERARIG